jgi:hypothetical protein
MKPPSEPTLVPPQFATRLMGDVRNNSLNVDVIEQRGERLTFRPRHTLHPVWFLIVGAAALTLGTLVVPRLDVPAVAAMSTAVLSGLVLVLVGVQIGFWARSAGGPWLVVDRAAGQILLPRGQQVLRPAGAVLQLITARRTSETQILATELNLLACDGLGQWQRCGIAGVACEDDTAFCALARMLAKRAGLPLQEQVEPAPDEAGDAAALDRPGLRTV